jgi:hypothetical protein
MTQNVLDQPLKITIIAPEKRVPLPIDALEWMLDRWGVRGKAVNAATLKDSLVSPYVAKGKDGENP